ncbi:MAG: S41 family peptidase [Pseudomonadales bacterium]|nr:S41 family peptidase [Pseudomonadales bacterium]
MHLFNLSHSQYHSQQTPQGYSVAAALIACLFACTLIATESVYAAEPAAQQTTETTTEADTPPPSQDSSQKQAAKKLPPRLPLNELRVFAEAFNRVSEAYVEEIDDRNLLENAIKGMLSQLDPHSAYLDKESFSDLQENTSGNYGGLGLQVTMDEGFLRVITPMDDTPAEKAGILAGDLILQLDDIPVKGLSLNDSIEAMRGVPGSKIKITLIHEGADQPTVVTLTREVIQIASVRHRMLEEGYGYIRIAQFQSGTGPEVAKAITSLDDEHKLRGLILDLRNNPGGILQSAVEVTDLFIDDGLIVYTTGRLANADLRFSATTPDSIKGIPLVLLVNEGSASASEIVAGALQDHGRAVIMGVQTFGKGSVQTILPLTNDKAIKLTTALYFTPNGRSIQAEGIIPDIEVNRSKVTRIKSKAFRVKERNLPKHLSNANGNDKTNNKEKVATTASTTESANLAATDYQLNEALTLLKGLNILAIKHQPPKG